MYGTIPRVSPATAPSGPRSVVTTSTAFELSLNPSNSTCTRTVAAVALTTGVETNTPCLATDRTGRVLIRTGR